MSPIASQEFKSWIKSEYAEAQGPFTAEAIGAPDFIIMRTSDLEKIEPELTDPEKAQLRTGFGEYLSDNVSDARDFVAELRNRHAL